MRPYQSPGMTLDKDSTSPDQRKLVLALQEDLRALGYIAGGLDGAFGPGTEQGLESLSYDLMHNNGASSQNDGAAPVAIQAYNKGRIGRMSAALDQPLAECLDDLISDPNVPKLPRASDPAAQNADALSAIEAITKPTAPIPFMLAMFVQESASRHYQMPTAKNSDDYITLGLDRNDKTNPEHVTSRGYGLGQATLFHHPPRPDEITALMVDPVANVRAAFSELRLKFNDFVAGPISRAVERDEEHPNLKLRICRYAPTDPKYLRDCRNCARTVSTVQIKQGTPLYQGSADTYQTTQYYPSANYGDVPDRSQFLCDWPYAARRYNGEGLNSFHYQTRILVNLTKLPPVQLEATS